MKGMFLATYTCRRHKKETLKQKQNYIERAILQHLKQFTTKLYLFLIKKKKKGVKFKLLLLVRWSKKMSKQTLGPGYCDVDQQ